MATDQGLLDDSDQPEQQRSNTADGDVWAQLGALASADQADPVLRLLVGEAMAKYEEVRGITATIASRYRAMVDAVPDAVIICNESGNVLDANEAACRLYELERESILQSSMLSLNPGMDSDFLASLHESQANGTGVTASSRILHDDGTNSALELHARKYLDAGRIRIIAVIRDLKSRGNRIQLLQESEASLRRLMLEIDKGLVFWGRRGQILSSNPSACRTFQASEAELRALTPDQLDRWQFTDATGNPMPKSALPWVCALETGKPQESITCGLQLPHIASTLWLSVSAVPHFSPGHAEPDMAASVFTDVTRLQRDALMFAQSQTLNSIGAWQLDLETQNLLCSAQVHAILDLPLSTPISRERLLGYFQGQDLERFRLALASVQDSGFDQFESLLTTSIGRKRRVRVRIHPLKTGDNIAGIFGTFKEIAV